MCVCVCVCVCVSSCIKIHPNSGKTFSLRCFPANYYSKKSLIIIHNAIFYY